jgi:hypothetical protein
MSAVQGILRTHTMACPTQSHPRPIRQAKYVTRSDMTEVTKIIGHGLGAYVLFQTTINWYHLKRTRERIEKARKQEKPDAKDD